ncbi:MAG: host-nuclease inhibitor Gam family protein [Pigmentiphaga sp.]
MAKKPIKAPAAMCRVPQDRQEAVNMIAGIGAAQREREMLKMEMDEQITALREKYDAVMAPFVETIKTLSQGVHVWAEAHRDELTQGGKVKTANLMTGEVRWRTTPPSVKAVRVKEAIEELKARHLAERFIRTKEEINKEAILADPAAVEGMKWLSISQSEDFVIVPFETDLEEVA